MPQGGNLEEATEPLRRDPAIGMRMSRKEYKRRITERDREWMTEAQGDLGTVLAETYRRSRGGHLE